MSNVNPQKIHEISAGALKAVYYVVIGLAIAEALHTTFVCEGAFLGLQCFTKPHINRFLLLLALLPTISRFVHGASIHLDTSSNKRYKTLFDFIAFSLQASIFYLMALSLSKPLAFCILLSLMLLGDAAWVIFLIFIKYIDELSLVIKQWLISDFLIVVLLFVIYYFDNTMSQGVSVYAIVIISLLATVADYYFNRNFYFPQLGKQNC